MIDYLQQQPQNLQLYSVQQSFQKVYEHGDTDTFNTYFSITNYSNYSSPTVPTQKIDHIFIVNPQFFDNKVAKQQDLEQSIKNIEASYINNTQNRLAVISLCSSDEEIKNCFNNSPVEELLRYQIEAEDSEFGVLNSLQGVLSCLKNIIMRAQSIQREDSVLSLTLISPNNFSSKQLKEEEMRQLVQDNFKTLNQNKQKILLNCISIDQPNNFFLSSIAEYYPQSMFYLVISKNSFLNSFIELMNMLSKIYITNVESTLTFENNSPLVQIEVVSYPSYWKKIDNTTYLFQYPFFYEQQDLSHLFKLKVTLKGTLEQQQAKEVFGKNKSLFIFNNEQYFFERNLEFPIAQQIQSKEENVNFLNNKCEQTFLKDKFIVPALKSVTEDLRTKQNQVSTLEKINKTLDQIIKSNSNSSYLIKYGKFVLENLQQLFNSQLKQELQQRSLSPYKQAEEALFVLQNQLFTNDFYAIKKKQYAQLQSS